jgi:2-iminobutanoate/2-iminopropanoate deaminase
MARPPRLTRLASGLLLAAAACAAPPSPTVHHEAANAIGPYSGSVATGDLLFCAGKIGDPALPFPQEVGKAIDEVEKELAASGLTLADVVSVNVFVTDLTQFTALNDVYAARFPKPCPARTTVGVTSLPKGAHVEIQAVARRR